MNSKNILIKVNQLYKIFGDGDKSALDLVKNGMGKDELLEKSNCVLGLNNINLNINRGKDTSCHGSFWFRQINSYKTPK